MPQPMLCLASAIRVSIVQAVARHRFAGAIHEIRTNKEKSGPKPPIAACAS